MTFMQMTKTKKWLSEKWRIVLGVMVGLVVFGLGYGYLATPEAIRRPQFEHAHVRLQIVAEGKQINFGDPQFQTPYDKDMCTEQLSARPIHFHDQKDQFVHLHWKGITGGLLLKYYGWNMVGGPPDALGYRLDDLPSIQKVSVFGRVLPSLQNNDTKLWVYTGDGDKHQKRELNEFLQQDLETFLGAPSLVNPKTSFWQRFLATPATAHSGEMHQTEAESEAHEQQTNQEGNADRQTELTRINNLLGNIVIFAQPTEPTDEQVTDRFTHLEPLSESTCGG